MVVPPYAFNSEEEQYSNSLYCYPVRVKDDFQCVMCILESFAFFYFVSCKTSQNVNILQLLT